MPLDQPMELEPAAEKEMAFLEHLEELRWHIIRALIAVMVVAIICFWQKEIVTSVLFGPRRAGFVTYELFCQYFNTFCVVPEFEIIQKDVGERFFTHLKVSFWLGIIFGFPFVFWEFWRFVRPGLYAHERKAARGMVFICSVLFFFGVLFGYFVIAPFAISFLAGYEFGDDLEPTATLSSYVSYMTMITIPTGFIYQLPVVAYFLGKIGLISSAGMKRYRRHATVVIFIAAAIITPPDVITQFLIAIPLLLLYQLSITIVKRLEAKQQ